MSASGNFVICSHSIVGGSTGGGTREVSAAARDRALFAGFLAGDDHALAALVDRHNDRLFRYSVQLLGNTPQAEDVVQELWLRVVGFRSDERVTADNPGGLFLRIVRNLCIDEHRRKRVDVCVDPNLDERFATEVEPELNEMEELVVLGIPRLPEELREPLVLHEYAGYSYEEIGEMIGESAGAVRTRAWRGRVCLGRLIVALLEARVTSNVDDAQPAARGFHENR